MATGTGKTLTSAAVIKLFLRTGNARRVLFLVDRLELEDQADKAFREYLKQITSVVFTKKTETTGDKRKLLFQQFNHFYSRTNTNAFFSQLILTL
jgi:type I restriction enzyme R subunit